MSNEEKIISLLEQILVELKQQKNVSAPYVFPTGEFIKPPYTITCEDVANVLDKTRS